MGKYLGPGCKMMRRIGKNINLKSRVGKNIESKCKINNPPGQHSIKKRKNLSNYGIQLNAKQTLKYNYFVFEHYLKGIYIKSLNKKKSSSALLIEKLEMRLDNIVYRIGLGLTRPEARQLVSHKSIEVTRSCKNRIISIPSFQVKVGDKIAIRKESKNQSRIKYSLKCAEKVGFPDWISININEMYGEIIRIPNKSDLGDNFDEQLVIEYYSR